MRHKVNDFTYLHTLYQFAYFTIILVADIKSPKTLEPPPMLSVNL